MSAKSTSQIMNESREVLEAPNENAVLNLILEMVTKIENRMENLETSIGKRLDEMRQDFLLVSNRVRTLEDKTTEIHKKLAECENSCQGLSNIFDAAEKQIKNNTRTLIHQDIRIKKLEETPILQPVVQPVTECETIKTLRNQLSELQDKVVDLQCRSMKNNLVFSGLFHIPNENCEHYLRNFIRQELGIEHFIEFGNVHRFGRRGRNNARPIVARFLYHKDLELVLQNAWQLKGTPFGISQQFPAEIINERKKLYPKMKEAKREQREVVLVRDKLYIDGQRFIPPTETPRWTSTSKLTPDLTREAEEENRTEPYQTPRNPKKRQRQSSSPPAEVSVITE